jgi:hypothetical protein
MFMNYVDHNIHHLASEHDITMSDIFHKVSKGKTKTMLTMDLELDKKTCQPSPAEGFEYQTHSGAETAADQLKHPGCHGDRFREFSCRNWGNLLDAKKCD